MEAKQEASASKLSYATRVSKQETQASKEKHNLGGFSKQTGEACT